MISTVVYGCANDSIACRSALLSIHSTPSAPFVRGANNPSTRYTYGKGYWRETRTTSETLVTVVFILSVLTVAMLRAGGAAAYTGVVDDEYVTLIMWDLFFFCMACITGWMYILFSTLRVRACVRVRACMYQRERDTHRES